MNKKNRIRKFQNIDIYPVITPEFIKDNDTKKLIDAVLEGGAEIIQLRMKKQKTTEFLKLADYSRKQTEKYNALLIINDRLDIALACKADGVHLGQDDMPLKRAKKIAEELILGISTHSAEEALTAQKNGADYINIGPIFPTETKKHAGHSLGTESLKKIISEISIPFTVMGGIKQNRIKDLTDAGAYKIAVVTAISMAEDPAAETRKFKKLINTII